MKSGIQQPLPGGCDVACDSPYAARCKVCVTHTRIAEVCVDGAMSRFCHKCSRFHPLAAFDSKGHTCSKWLQRLRDDYRAAGKEKKRRNTETRTTEMTKTTTGGGAGESSPASSSGVDADAAAAGVTLPISAAVAANVANVMAANAAVLANAGAANAGAALNAAATTGDAVIGVWETHFRAQQQLHHHHHQQQQQQQQAPAATQWPSTFSDGPFGVGAGGTGDSRRNNNMRVMSPWVKLHGFTPAELPLGGLTDALGHWTHSQYVMALSASAQPGCTLLTFDFLLPEDDAAGVRARWGCTS